MRTKKSKPCWPTTYNETGHDRSIFVTVLRMWNRTTFYQELLWPSNKTVSSVIEDYQKICLGDERSYRVIDFYIPKDNFLHSTKNN